MTEPSTFDVVVVGAGPAGEVCAGRLADQDLAVALVEDRLVGGECSFWGCMPSKALIRPGQLLAEARRVPGAAEAVGTVDVRAALRRRDEAIHHLSDAEQLPWIERRDIRLVRGHGRLVGERTVRVGDATLEARRAVVLAPGTAPVMPPIPGLTEARPWTNREATTTARVPSRLIVLGGGTIGVELAYAFATLGAEVTLIESAPRVLAREEPFASDDVSAGLTAVGVTLHVGTQAVAVTRRGDEVGVELDDGSWVHGQEILVAVGRRPLTADLGLECVGLTPGETIEVDATFRVPGHPWLYALGDVNGHALLTHMGKYQARLAADHILGRRVEPLAEALPAPRVTFTDPQVAAVGHTLAGAREAGIDARAVDVATADNPGASFIGKGAPGTARIVVDESRRVIVGATFTGTEIAESLHAATVAVVAETPLDLLWHAVPTFPTRAEIWLKLLEAYGL